MKSLIELVVTYLCGLGIIRNESGKGSYLVTSPKKEYPPVWCAAALVLTDMNMRKKQNIFKLEFGNRALLSITLIIVIQRIRQWVPLSFFTAHLVYWCFRNVKFQWNGRKNVAWNRHLKYVTEQMIKYSEQLLSFDRFIFTFFMKGWKKAIKTNPQCYIGLVYSQWLEWINLMLVNKLFYLLCPLVAQTLLM